MIREKRYIWQFFLTPALSEQFYPGITALPWNYRETGAQTNILIVLQMMAASNKFIA